jgi:hypothetical protein
MSKHWTRFSVFIYNSKGERLREGIARREGFPETMKYLVKGYDLGEFTGPMWEVVRAGDIFDWLAECSLRSPWEALLTAPEPQPGKVLEFKPQKELGA